MKLLLGATIALLLGALAVSWQGMQTGVKNAPADEIARLKKQVAELRAEQDKLQLEKQIQQIKAMPESAPSPSQSEMAAIKAQLDANQAALAQLEAEKAAAAREKLEAREQARYQREAARPRAPHTPARPAQGLHPESHCRRTQSLPAHRRIR